MYDSGLSKRIKSIMRSNGGLREQDWILSHINMVRDLECKVT